MGSFFFLSLSLLFLAVSFFSLDINFCAHSRENREEQNRMTFGSCLSFLRPKNSWNFFLTRRFGFLHTNIRQPNTRAMIELPSIPIPANNIHKNWEHELALINVYSIGEKNDRIKKNEKRTNKKRFNQKEQYKCWTANKKKIYSKSKLIIKKIVSTNNKSKAQPTNETEEKIGLYILEIKIHETRETNR